VTAEKAILASVGIHGVMSYVVTQRTREIGIRMSFSATCGKWWATCLGANLLREVKPSAPAILIATAGLLGVVALVACYLPARRAARVDPMTALRYE
jgi:putative ABC transport system permease protein